jgi:ABC-type multidrug transport system fused ATPase/permease subunit
MSFVRLFGGNYLKNMKLILLFLFITNFSISIIPTFLLFIQQKIIDNISSGVVENRFVVFLSCGILAYFILKLMYSNLLTLFLYKIRKFLLNDMIFSYINQQAFNRKKEPVTFPVIVNQYIEGVINDYYRGGLNISSDFIIAFSSYAYAFFINKWIAILASLFMIINMLINRKGASFISKIQRENSFVNAGFLSKFNNLLSNFQVLKTNNLMGKADEIFNNNNESFSRSQLKLKNKMSNYSVINAVYYAVQKYSIILLAVSFFFNDLISAGELISCIFLASFLSAPLIKLGEGFRQVISTESYRNELKRIINKENNNQSQIKLVGETICYKSKKITYENDKEKIIFEDVSLEIKKGNKYLLLGKNGLGKSTLLLDLVYTLTNSSFRNQIGVVFQNESLMKMSIEENISFFKAHNSSNIKDILKVFKIDKSLDTIVNDSVTNLSRGEIQRILIARHIINGKRFLILDEALSGVEKKLQNEIFKYLLDKKITLIMISHKIDKSLINRFDQILLISNGVVKGVKTENGGEVLYERYMDE